MEDIDTLIYVIIIIIGIVFSIIKKLAGPKPQQKTPQRLPPKMRPTVQRPQVSAKEKQQPKELTPFEQFFKVLEEQVTESAPSIKKPEPTVVKEKSASPKPLPPTVKPPPTKPKPLEREVKPKIQPERRIAIWSVVGREKQTLRDLILAAEILGPCKAKRRKPTI